VSSEDADADDTALVVAATRTMRARTARALAGQSIPCRSYLLLWLWPGMQAHSLWPVCRSVAAAPPQESREEDSVDITVGSSRKRKKRKKAQRQRQQQQKRRLLAAAADTSRGSGKQEQRPRRAAVDDC
jgi:hypothetical protein